jgi:hypothetical protein
MARHLGARFRAPSKYMYTTFLEILNHSCIVQEGVEVQVEIQLQTAQLRWQCWWWRKRRCSWWGRFGGGGDSSCEETVRAGCGPFTAKTLPDRLLLYLLHLVSAPALVWRSGGPGDACR